MPARCDGWVKPRVAPVVSERAWRLTRAGVARHFQREKRTLDATAVRLMIPLFWAKVVSGRVPASPEKMPDTVSFKSAPCGGGNRERRAQHSPGTTVSRVSERDREQKSSAHLLPADLQGVPVARQPRRLDGRRGVPPRLKAGDRVDDQQRYEQRGVEPEREERPLGPEEEPARRLSYGHSVIRGARCEDGHRQDMGRGGSRSSEAIPGRFSFLI